MKKIIFTCVLFFTSQALALNFTGTWFTATGNMTETNGRLTPCSEIKIQLLQTDQEFKIIHYEAKCGKLFSDWGPSKMEIKGTQVYEDGERIGEFKDDKLLTTSRSGGISYAFNLKAVEGDLDNPTKIKSYYGVRNMLGAIVIEGALERQ